MSLSRASTPREHWFAGCQWLHAASRRQMTVAVMVGAAAWAKIFVGWATMHLAHQ